MNDRTRKHPSSILIGSIMGGLAIFSSISAHSEGLKAIYEQALENDHEYRAAKAELEAGLEAKYSSRSQLMPNIEGSATLGKSDVEQRTTGVTSDATTTIYEVALTQPIFNMSAWHNYKRGKLLANGAELKFEIAEQALILRSAETYLSVLKSADETNTAKAEQNALSHQLEQTKQRFEVGLTAITEVHEAQAAYDSSTASRLLADGGLGIAFESLEALTGKSYKTLYPLQANFTATPPEPLAREEWVNMALENNTALQIASTNAKADKANAKSKKSGHLPTIYGSASYTKTDVESDFSPRYDNNTAIGLQLNIPIYDGGLTSASRREAASQELRTRELYLKAKRDAVLDARTSHLTVLTAAATVKARAQAITSNRSALEATQAGYDVGTRDLVDVLNSQRFLYRAERDYYDALYDYILATLKLKQAAGILTVDDLYNLDKSLDTQRTISYK